jgi:hypothetical protein
MSVLRCALLAVPLCLPVTLLGQDSISPVPPPRADTSVFRRGQWAAQFTGSVSLTGLGVLRFSAPTRAVLLDVVLAGGHAKQTIRDTAGTRSTSVSNFSLNTRLGSRVYHPRGSSAALYHTVGVAVGFSHTCFLAPGGSCSNGWNGGVFADFGGAYLVTPRLSLGGSVGLNFTYQRSLSEGPGRPTIRVWSYNGGLSGPVFVSTFYF